MFYRMYMKENDKTYAIAWCKDNSYGFDAIFYYLHSKEWRFVGPELKDTIVGYDPDEDDWEWGFHILPEAAEQISKEEAEKICGFKINAIRLEEELNKLIKKITNPDGSFKEEFWDFTKLDPLKI